MPLTEPQIRRAPISLEFSCRYCGTRVRENFRNTKHVRKYCDRACRDAHTNAARPLVERTCACGALFFHRYATSHGEVMCCPSCRDRTRNWRKNAKRRGAESLGVNRGDLAAMRSGAVGTACPSCGNRMVAEPYTQRSAELDHVVPIVLGGSHELRNLRMICRDCNLARPRDGSDLRLVAS